MFPLSVIRPLALLWLATALSCSVALAAPDVPPELEPWVGWVLDKHPTHGCITTPSSTPCVWPGELAVSVDSEGGRFALRVVTDREATLPLPGGPGQWPLDVHTDTGPIPVQDTDGQPRLTLPAGTHTVRGLFAWDALPQSLPLPPETGHVRLQVTGEQVDRPRVDANGRLHLDARGGADLAEGDALELDVTRHIVDGVPVRVQTRLEVRVAGGARELNLGTVLLDGTVPVGIDSELPVRVGDDQRTLTVMVRPGTWSVVVDAVHDGPVPALTAPTVEHSQWPAEEFWSVSTDDAVRTVTVSGGTGIDPARTPIRADLHSHPAYRVGPGDALSFDEMRRGVPEPPSSVLRVQRTIWVDDDGAGLTVQDRLRGTLEDDWRLAAREPLELGHVSVMGADRVITQDDRGVGVEVRERDVSLVAESRLPSPWQAFPAVGWDIEAEDLQATVNVPPGWELLWVSGADTVRGTALSAWSLFDVFIVLVAAGAFARLLGIRVGVLSLVVLAWTGHDDAAPQLVWLLVLAAVALQLRKEGSPEPSDARRRLTVVVQGVAAAALLLQLATYAANDLDARLFPTQQMSSSSSVQHTELGQMQHANMPAAGAGGLAREEAQKDADIGSFQRNRPNATSVSRSSPKRKKAPGKTNALYQTAQVDPAAVVQTGPGIPAWSGSSASAGWSGRVSPDHPMRLWLAPPAAVATLAVVKFMLLGLLAVVTLRLDKLWATRGRQWWRDGLPLVALATVAGLTTGTTAHAEPSATVLAELETRITVGPDCGTDCVSVSHVGLFVDDNNSSVRILAEVHAVATTAWAVPGPHTSWQPTRVRLDGADTVATRRGTDGFLYVRVPAGVHSITVDGPLSDAGELTLQFLEAPHAVDFDQPGYRLGGLRRDGTIDNTLQLTRIQTNGANTVARGSDNLTPDVTVRRSLDLGLPWRVSTSVELARPTGSPLTLEVPLLPGEAVTDGAHEVRDGKVLVSFDGDAQVAVWKGTLAVSDSVRLEAPDGVPWTEEWALACSPIFACTPTASEGLAPIRHVTDGRWQPTWSPWPGEYVDIAVTRPDAIAGQTVTIDSFSLTTTPQLRETTHTLRMTVRTSQGGPHPVRLSDGAELRSLQIDGRTLPARIEAGSVDLPLQPGSHQVELEWSEPDAAGLVLSGPQVDLGASAVNGSLKIHATDEHGKWRWVLGTLGPRLGPKALHLVWMALLAGLAAVLGRALGPHRTGAPFSTSTWAALLLGASLLPAAALAVVAAWLVAVVVRSRRAPAHWLAHNFLQIVLVLALPVVGVLLLWAFLEGLGHGAMGRPGLWISGQSASPYDQLVWQVDRTTGSLPRTMVVWLPPWTGSVLAVGWALWLVAAAVKRLPWLGQALSHGGWVRSSPKQAPAAAVTEE